MIDTSRHSFRAFISQVRDLVEPQKTSDAEVTGLEAFPVTPRQCLYVLDWADRRCIYQKGVQSFLGYEPGEFTFENIISSYHPDDQDQLYGIIRAAVEYCITNDLSQDDFCLQLGHRVRHKDGHYIKVLRQSSVFQLGQMGGMVSNFSLLTDITFIDNSARVFWDVQASRLDEQAFRRRIYSAFKDLFTRREREILRLMEQGFKNREIAGKLYLSKHTVATHRKNIYRKSGCKSLQELLDFAYNCGILGG